MDRARMQNYTPLSREQIDKPASFRTHPDHFKAKLKVAVVESFRSAQFLTFEGLDEAATKKEWFVLFGSDLLVL